MDVQVQRFDNLNDLGQEVVHNIGNNPDAVRRINNVLQEFQERWDNLVQQMDLQSKEVCTQFMRLGEGGGGFRSICHFKN